jgi:phage terminase large subunit-like protein
VWDLSCPDWEARIREGRPLVPELPLIQDEADLGVAFFDEMVLPDVPGLPKLKDAAGEWFRDIVRAAFGSWDPATQTRFIRDIFALAPKGQSKTSYSSALLLAVMLMNKRPRAEALFIGPTQAISDRAYEQAVGMIDASPQLKKRFRPRDHIKTIEDLLTKSEAKVKTFDVNILTGSILIFALLDELHLLGKNPHAAKVLRQIRGGLQKTPEGFLLITTTQSDEPPVGAFSDELLTARKTRDGAFRGQRIRPMLPVLYEFPPDLARAGRDGEPAPWEDPSLWQMVMPNLGRSVHLDSLMADWETEKEKGEAAKRIWASQHLNIEIGLGLRTNSWSGANDWPKCVDTSLSLEALLERSDVITGSIDGGGMDDLLGLCLLGRERGTGHWLAWFKAWAHRIALERRKSEMSRLLGFERDGDLVVVDEVGTHVAQAAEIVEQVHKAGLLGGVGLDSYDIKDIVAELTERDVTGETLFGDQKADLVQGIPQGWRISGAIKTTELKLAGRKLKHAGRPMMSWCVSNAKVEPKGNAISITKAAAGVAKIDPLVALFNAVELMTRDPRIASGADQVFL